MKATCWMGKQSIEVRDVPDPKILNQRDAIVRITSTAICGSDLHLYNGFVQPMKKGDILGHEFMGEVMEVGRAVKTLKVGDRVVVPFTIACGECWQCRHENWSLCENSNPNAALAEQALGHSASGAFGYSHLTGGFAGGQAEFARVPFADVGPLKIENGFRTSRCCFSPTFCRGLIAPPSASFFSPPISPPPPLPLLPPSPSFPSLPPPPPPPPSPSPPPLPPPPSPPPLSPPPLSSPPPSPPPLPPLLPPPPPLPPLPPPPPLSPSSPLPPQPPRRYGPCPITATRDGVHGLDAEGRATFAHAGDSGGDRADPRGSL